MADFPSAVQAYSSEDFGSESNAYGELVGDLQNELELKRLRLTDYVGSTPPFLTPAMSRWYARFINTKRKPALDAVETLFGRVRLKQDAGGIFLERRRDQIEDQRLGKKRAAKESHVEKNAAEYNRLAEIKSDYENAKRKFADLQARNNGRPPRIIHWWYWVLLFVVGIFEVLINYEAFKSLRIMTPFTALGSTGVIAFALASASHLHGTLAKQWKAYAGPPRDDIDRAAAIRMFSLGTLALSIVLGAVWYARSNYLADIIMETAIIGGKDPTWLSTIGGSLTLNFAAYIVGVILAFLCHDEDPAFTDAFEARESLAQKYRSADDRLTRQLNRTFGQIDAIADKEISEARSHDRTLQHLEAYQSAHRAFEKIAAKDAEVVGALEAYRGSLVREGPKVGLIIEIPGKLRKDEFEVIDPNEYAAMPLALKHL